MKVTLLVKYWEPPFVTETVQSCLSLPPGGSVVLKHCPLHHERFHHLPLQNLLLRHLMSDSSYKYKLKNYNKFANNNQGHIQAIFTSGYRLFPLTILKIIFPSLSKNIPISRAFFFYIFVFYIFWHACVS